MENAISTFCKSMASFCNHVDASSRSLSDAIRRRPLPLDSAASAFLQCLDRRIASTAADLSLLDSMAFATVSFEELLGHCNEVVKINSKYIGHVEERMRDFGYVGEVDDEIDGDFRGELEIGSPINCFDEVLGDCGSVSASRTRLMTLDEDLLIEDSISIKSLGLSDACLSTLASEGDDCFGTSLESSKALSIENGLANGASIMSQASAYASNGSDSTKNQILTPETTENVIIKASKNDYDGLPSSIKCLVSWEELRQAVVTMNCYLSGKESTKGFVAFNQEELEKMGLARKGRACVLVLLRINQLVVDTIDGTIFYRIVTASH